jgi:DNA polymerase
MAGKQILKMTINYHKYLALLSELRLRIESLKLYGQPYVSATEINNPLKELICLAREDVEEKIISKQLEAENQSSSKLLLDNEPQSGAELTSNHKPPGGLKETLNQLNGDSLDQIGRDVAKCRKCGLAKTRTNTVPGAGLSSAKLMFIGEAPGADEDKQGEPFVGRAGKLFTNMIEAMGLQRNEVYIANILKCRPPKNRDPEAVEVEMCKPFLKRQITEIKPRIICALGRVSAQTLLKTKSPLSTLRGNFHKYEGTDLLATFHPAYLLRNPAAKKDAWNDLQIIMEKMGLTDKR